MCKVSIIVPIYNVAEYISKCIESLLCQTLEDIEIICINDCTLDNSMDIVKTYQKSDSRIVVINHEQHRGVSAARNTGLSFARGQYIASVDPDDWVACDFIEKMYNKAIENQVDIVLNTNIQKTFKDGRTNEHFEWHGYMKQCEIGELLDSSFSIANTHCMTAAHIYKKTLLDKHNLHFPEGYIHEDNYFKATTELYVDKIFAFYGSPYFYLQRDDGIMGTLGKQSENTLRIYMKIYDYYLEHNVLDRFPLHDIRPLLIPECDTDIQYLIMTEKQYLIMKEVIHKVYLLLMKEKLSLEKIHFLNALLHSDNFATYAKLLKKDLRLTILREKVRICKQDTHCLTSQNSKQKLGLVPTPSKFNKLYK